VTNPGDYGHEVGLDGHGEDVEHAVDKRYDGVSKYANQRGGIGPALRSPGL
jgi:hypothetical protein